MESNETTTDWPKKKPFVPGLWAVRYQVKDVERSIPFYGNATHRERLKG